MKKLQAFAGIAAALGLAAAFAAAPAGAERGSYNNWHVHDGGSGVDANGLVHRSAAFFPSILPGDYSEDPAYCPDATDKLLLPAGSVVPPAYQSTGWTTGGAVVYYALTAR